MLSLVQRLVLGCSLLLALVVGSTLFVRSSLLRISATDATMVAADQAGAMLTDLESALAREQLLAAQFEAGPSASRGAELHLQMQQTQRQLKAAAAVTTDGSLRAMQQQHGQLSSQVGHASAPEAMQALASSQLRVRIATLDQSLQQIIAAQSASRLAIQRAAVQERAAISRRILTT